MRYKNYLENVREIFKNNLNSFLVNRGLEPISLFAGSQYLLGQNNVSIAIYPDSPSGDVYKETNEYAEASVTISFYFNEIMSPENDEICIDYYDALIDFIHEYRFGEYDLIQNSFPILVSAGYEYNGVAILLNSRLNTLCDYDY